MQIFPYMVNKSWGAQGLEVANGPQLGLAQGKDRTVGWGFHFTRRDPLYVTSWSSAWSLVPEGAF